MRPDPHVDTVDHPHADDLHGDDPHGDDPRTGSAGHVRVDTAALGRVAAAVTAAAVQAGDAASAVPGLIPPPRWASAYSAERAAEAAGHRMRELSADLSGTSASISTTVLEYEDADARTSTRFRAAR
ncbi:hypothetical protein [Actinoplanes sp. NPDC051851]|uniref:hypothetical protein n=1 Tax=Actinoplanes sp. NPDC051851 TaxID=3154753 RepID=UPI003436A1B7